MKYKNKKVAVLGFGLEGKDASKFLLKQGAKVTVFDQKSEADLDTKGFSKAQCVCGEDYLSEGLEGFDIIIRSPGVYRWVDELVRAEKSGIEISSPMKLFFDHCGGKVIGVTGTKGKGTTATLIYEILKANGKDVYLAGNIGKPFLGLLPKMKKNTWLVLELSSFQLIDMTKSPHISVVLNITTDHLDWHKDRKEYVDAKKSIVEHQGTEDFAVINFDYEDSMSFSKFGKGKKYYFSKSGSKSKRKEGSYVENGKIVLNINNKLDDIGSVDDLTLRGEHNWENVAAATCASKLAGASIDSLKQTIFSFKGLEHRLEFVREIKGVKFYNDSFGTGPETAIAALKSFTESTTALVGGFEKNLDYTEMAKVIAHRKNIENVILIGDIGPRIKKDLLKAKYEGNIVNTGKKPMKDIVQNSFEITPKGGVVVLAPATSSFDMFENYKERGNEFKEAVNNLYNGK